MNLTFVKPPSLGDIVSSGALVLSGVRDDDDTG